MRQIRFIIINVPQSPLKEQLSNLMVQLRDEGKTYTAVTYPPHVTLRTGAIVPEKEINTFLKGFESHLHGWSPFSIELDGIHSDTYRSEGAEKRIVYYKIKPNNELNRLNEKLLKYKPFIKSNPSAFHPHLSLAYDDLSSQGHSRIKRLMADNPNLLPSGTSWICDTVSLYFKPADCWIPFHEFETL